MLTHRAELLFFFLHFYGFKILGFEDLAAIETLHVVYSVSPRDNLGANMLTSGLHKQALR